MNTPVDFVENCVGESEEDGWDRLKKGEEKEVELLRECQER